MPEFTILDQWWARPGPNEPDQGLRDLWYKMDRDKWERPLKERQVNNESARVALQRKTIMSRLEQEQLGMQDAATFQDWWNRYKNDPSTPIPKFNLQSTQQNAIGAMDSYWGMKSQQALMESRIQAMQGITGLYEEDRPMATKLWKAAESGGAEEAQAFHDFMNEKMPNRREEEFKKEKELKQTTSSSTWTTMTDKQRADYTHELVTNRDRLRARLADITQQKELIAQSLENTKLSAQGKFINETEAAAEINRLQSKLTALNDEFDSLTGKAAGDVGRSGFDEGAPVSADDYINSILR